MATTRFLIISLLIIIVSCNSKEKDKTLKIYHLKPNSVSVNTDTLRSYGWYSKTRNDFFAIKNFDATNEKHKIKVDSFVVNYIKKDSFLTKNKNVEWSLFFFKYGNGITENTKHQFDTDYTIHNLFAFKKRVTAYTFDTRTSYLGTSYYFKKGDSITNEKRKIIVDYFKIKSH